MVLYSLFVRNHKHLVLFALPEVPVQNFFALEVETETFSSL